jgi:hypothetical protein
MVTTGLFYALSVFGIDTRPASGLELGVDEAVLLLTPLVRGVRFYVLHPAFDAGNALLAVAFVFFFEGITRVRVAHIRPPRRAR